MTWFWLNMPLAAAFFSAWVGIPLWLVFKYSDRAAQPAAVTPRPGPARPSPPRSPWWVPRSAPGSWLGCDDRTPPLVTTG